MLSMTGVTVIDLAAHSESINRLLIRLDQDVNRVDRKRFSYEHYFPDFEDRLINEELPAADYSSGGVYLIGTSNLKWATRFWELPEDQRRLIHNYGIGGSDHVQHFQLIRHLVEDDGLLAAGGSKTLIVLGASYHATGDGVNDVNRFFPSLWERHGQYSYDVAKGITPKKTNPWLGYVHFERIRMAGFLRSVTYTAARQLGYHTAVRRHEPAVYRADRTEWLGPRWQENMHRQVRAFEEMASYLRARDVRLVVVFLPIGSWDHDLPFARAYMEQMREASEKNSVQVLDWSEALTDDDFADSNHPNLYGVDKLQPRFLDIALPFLRSTGALPPPGGILARSPTAQ